MESITFMDIQCHMVHIHFKTKLPSLPVVETGTVSTSFCTEGPNNVKYNTYIKNQHFQSEINTNT